MLIQTTQRANICAPVRRFSGGRGRRWRIGCCGIVHKNYGDRRRVVCCCAPPARPPLLVLLIVANVTQDKQTEMIVSFERTSERASTTTHSPVSVDWIHTALHPSTIYFAELF